MLQVPVGKAPPFPQRSLGPCGGVVNSARAQPGMTPSRSAAIRRLLYLKLDAEAARQPRKGRK